MKKSNVVRIAVIVLALIFAASLSFAAEKKSAAGSEPGMKTETKTETKTVTKEPASTAKIDINTADKEELVKLPGIGEATAQKIIDGRPYKSKDQLKSKKIVSASEYGKIKDKIVAKQMKK